MMSGESDGAVLRIYFGETDKYQGKGLYEWILTKAKDAGLAGATVFRGIAGFGSHHKIHTAKILDYSTDLPIVVEIIDSIQKIEGFLPVLEEALKEGVATVEKASVRIYRAKG